MRSQPPSHSTVTDPSRSPRGAEDFLRTANETATRQWISSLGIDDIAHIHGNRFYPLYVNLAAIFGRQRAPEAIRGMAAEATKASLWSHRAVERYFASLAEAASAGRNPASEPVLHFDNWDRDLLASLLARGRGLIVCFFRLGLYPFVVPDLALLGFPVGYLLVPGKAETYKSGLASLERNLSARAVASDESGSFGRTCRNLLHLQPISSSRSDAATTLAAALRRGEVVGLLPDGNAGADGAWGASSRLGLDFFGFPIAVKSGPARLSVLCGSPILPLMAIKTGVSSGSLLYGEPILPPSRPSAVEKDVFIGNAMRLLYGFLEAHAGRFPEQWEGAAAIHRWRTFVSPEPGAHGAGIESCEQALARDIEIGRTCRIDQRRAVVVPAPDGDVWVDSETMSAFKPPPSAAQLFRALSGPAGVGSEWLNAFVRDGIRPRILTLLAQLRSRGLIQVLEESPVAAHVARDLVEQAQARDKLPEQSLRKETMLWTTG
jgi:hypothetical protein